MKHSFNYAEMKIKENGFPRRQDYEQLNPLTMNLFVKIIYLFIKLFENNGNEISGT